MQKRLREKAEKMWHGFAVRLRLFVDDRNKWGKERP
jgi:hypothetical protein